MTVADRIKSLRISKDITQEELAKKIGAKDRSSISKIEGKGNDISLRDIARIAEALDTSIAYLMGWSDDQQAENEINDNLNSAKRIYEYQSKLSKSKVKPKDVQRAMELYELYESSSPEVRSAVELLLKSAQQKP